MNAPGWDLLVGPVAGLVIALVAVYVLTRARLVVPGRMYDETEKRNAALEAEAVEQDKLLRAQAELLTEQRVANARLQEQVKHLTGEVRRLTEEVTNLTDQIELLRKGA